ncbi:hypothetical protein D9M69_527820 [compost metagenome]
MGRGEWRDRPGDGKIGLVGGKRHVDRAPVIERFGYEPLGFIGDVLRGDHGMGADHRLGHAAKQAVLAIPQGMVHQGPGVLDLQVGRTHQVEHRQVFGIGPGDTVERTELAHAIGGTDRPHALDARVAVGGVGGVQFVAAAHPALPGRGADRIADGEGIVAWNAKDVGDAEVGQPGQDMLDDGGGHGGSCGRCHATPRGAGKMPL